MRGRGRSIPNQQIENGSGHEHAVDSQQGDEPGAVGDFSAFVDGVHHGPGLIGAVSVEHDAAQWGGKLGEAEVVVVVGVGVFKFF